MCSMDKYGRLQDEQRNLKHDLCLSIHEGRKEKGKSVIHALPFYFVRVHLFMTLFRRVKFSICCDLMGTGIGEVPSMFNVAPTCRDDLMGTSFDEVPSMFMAVLTCRGA
ncbi:hypothetical protein NL676_030241 [Syzygium grande]|nr:hypothetical protein NL676_030241 [Syzygium grande]